MGAYAVLSIGIGTLVSGVIPISVLVAEGGIPSAPLGPTLMTALLGFVVSGLSSSLVVFTAIGFARVAARASSVLGRAAIITTGVTGGVGIVVLPLCISLDGTGPLIGGAALVTLGTALALAGGALAPWRYGFARPTSSAQATTDPVPA